MKFNKVTLITMGVTVLTTLGVITIVNNVDALEDVSKRLNGDTGWWIF